MPMFVKARRTNNVVCELNDMQGTGMIEVHVTCWGVVPHKAIRIGRG